MYQYKRLLTKVIEMRAIKTFLRKQSIVFYLGRKALRALSYIKNVGERKKGVLIYVGLHKGMSFSKIYSLYEKCYGFEPNPELFKSLEKEFDKVGNVRLFNVAVTDYDGEIDFNISSNEGASSSIGNFSEKWQNYATGEVKMDKTIRVPCINLYRFIEKENITSIDDYISDIQGMDLSVLKTLKPLIESKRIKKITCEVVKDEYRNIYRDLPDNSESGFNELLKDNYELIAKGWGVLVEGKINETPQSWWEMDCMWKIK